MQITMQDHRMAGHGNGLVSHAFLRWSLSALVVLSAYGGAFAALLHHRAAPERLAGSPPAIMLEFAAEPTAPVVENIAETVQPQMRLAEAETRPDPVAEQAEPEIVKTPPSDFTEQKRKRHRRERVPERAERKRHRKPEQQGVTGQREQKAAAPDIAARTGKTFAAPGNSRSNGFNGKSDKAWKDRVHRRIQGVGRRMERQLPGARGVAYVFFSYDAAGRILQKRVSRSSGNEKIDQLALRIVGGSSPLPVPPDAGDTTVPVRVN